MSQNSKFRPVLKAVFYKTQEKTMNLKKIKIGYSPLSDSIYLYRHGKDENLALDKREAEADVMAVLVEHMMHDAPKGSKKTVQFGNKKYKVQVTPA